jgi:hypothetical protein
MHRQVTNIRARATAPPQSLVSGFDNLSFSNDRSYLIQSADDSRSGYLSEVPGD